MKINIFFVGAERTRKNWTRQSSATRNIFKKIITLISTIIYLKGKVENFKHIKLFRKMRQENNAKNDDFSVCEKIDSRVFPALLAGSIA